MAFTKVWSAFHHYLIGLRVRYQKHENKEKIIIPKGNVYEKPH